ncbi:MAG: leucine-rich repeat domain-containing protein, partial [Oscillospiraceae bacterium]|nr:leucine-rich repeat domain-containing protein [Oscillospiraceae bacterium]
MDLKGKHIAFAGYIPFCNSLAKLLKSCGCEIQDRPDLSTDFIIFGGKPDKYCLKTVKENKAAGKVTEIITREESEDRFLDLSASGNEFKTLREYLSFRVRTDGTLVVGYEANNAYPQSGFRFEVVNGAPCITPQEGKNVTFCIPSHIGGRAVTVVYALPQADRVTELLLPETLQKLGEMPRMLQSISIPASITQIKQYAFKNSKELAKVEFAGEIPELGFEAFSGCGKLADKNGNIIIGDYFFGFASRKLKIPAGKINSFTVAPT